MLRSYTTPRVYLSTDFTFDGTKTGGTRSEFVVLMTELKAANLSKQARSARIGETLHRDCSRAWQSLS